MRTLHLHSRARLRQSGMTLVELMISITIGLFIIGAALLVFQSTSGVGRQISELTQLRQQGAHAFRVIGKQIRETGSVQPKYIASRFKYEFEGTYTWAGGTPVSDWVPPEPGGFLSLSQQISSAALQPFLRNCLGQTVTSTKTRSDFYVKDNALMCETGSNVGGEPVIGNVHAFQVRYRIKDGNNKKFVNTVTNWNDVDAIEVCLDLVGVFPTPDGGANYTDCAGSPTASRGGRLHVVQRNLFSIYTGQR